jgi:transcription antitermination factor NusB
MSLATERRAARERALGLLYEAEAKGTSGAEILASLPVVADEFAVALVLAVDEHRARIDSLLERFAKGWTLARMPALDRAALRMGSAELISRADVPTAVVLAETVDLASRFSTDDSGRFVNGLLARMAEELRGAGAADAAPDDAAPDDEVDALAPQVDAVVVDLDGVIRHWDPEHALRADDRLGLPAGTIAAAALDAGRLERVVDGRLPFEAWCEEIGQVVAGAHGVDAAPVADAWATATWQIDLAVVELLQAAREAVPVALLSNASTHLQLDLDLSGIGDQFDLVVGSAELGVAKPAPEAFRAVAEGLDVALERSLFVDDTLANVEGARALGMRAERFTGVDELRDLFVSLQLVR